jgi:2-dehydropantoate 2-reductase
MRFVIYGAGAIGGSLGISLLEAGAEVVLIARGEQFEVLRARGLTLVTPEGSKTLPVSVVSHPREILYAAGDVVLLAMKSQDTEAALRDLAAVAPSTTPVVCMQNGVENERLALRRFENVYGAMVISPATYLTHGQVSVTAWPSLGLSEVGRYPEGSDSLSEELAATLAAARWASRSLPDIMRWKYAKLLDNLSNAAQVVVGVEARGGQVATRARSEGVEVLDHAGIDYVAGDEMAARRAEAITNKPIDGRERVGASTWQSVQRGAVTVESDYLNGEVVRIARLNHRSAPINELLRRLSNEIAWSSGARGAMREEEFFGLLGG